jgi:hypothetical protein
MPKSIKYAAVVTDVIDVSLLGTADLGYWQSALQAEQLEPIEHEGQAQILILTADAKYMGLRFRELSFAVFARDVSGLTNLTGSFLLRAFNSRRSFAWIERTLFKTPYYPGAVTVEWEPPLIQVRLRSSTFEVRSGQSLKTMPDTSKIMGWNGPVFLPSKPEIAVAKSKLFFAHVMGLTQEFAFDPARDVLTLPDTAEPPFLALRESNFRPTNWSVRTAAMHSKSKTYSRGDCPPFVAEKIEGLRQV